ncbi:MAG: hypothetical protein IJZ29_00750 [Clostridia bacterium]|nr:hypothetical protein [Clostridia bacterium]
MKYGSFDREERIEDRKDFARSVSIIFLEPVLLALVIIAFNAVVIMCLWNWFIVPLGAVQIGYWLALGIALTVKLVTNHEMIMLDIVMNALALGIGGIVQFFI